MKRMHSTPSEEIQRRIKTLQSAMADNRLDAALIVQRVDLFYFSGTGQDAHLFVPLKGSPILLVRKSFERALQDSPLEHVVAVESLSGLKKTIEREYSCPLKRIGMESDVFPVNNYRLYSKLFPNAAINDVSPLIRETRMVKSEYELEMIRQAARMNDALVFRSGSDPKRGDVGN